MDHTINATVGERVHAILWRRNIPQRELARRLGVTQQAVSRKLRGDRPFDLPELYETAAFLGVELGELLPRVDSNHQPAGYGNPTVVAA